MLEKLDRAILALLLAVHGGLLLWALIGFAELSLPVSWPRLSNPLFSPAMLFLQWTAITAASLAFLLGYRWRWRNLRRAMVVCYAVMAAICAVQTFTILQHDSRFIEMGIEYGEYLAIIAYLFLSPTVRRRIGPDAMVAAGT